MSGEAKRLNESQIGSNL